MEEVNNSKKKVILITSICVATLLLVAGISFALWQTTRVQEDMNIIAGGCFDVSLEGNDPINLANAYPIKDSEGAATTPFTFTIKNKCSNETSYNVSLESLDETTFDSSKIKVMLDDDMKLYNTYSETEKYFETSKEARLLVTGSLGDNETVTYNLRMWIDESASNNEQNKVFASKIVVTAVPVTAKYLADKVDVGSYISMTPTSTSFMPSGELTGCLNDADCTQNTLNPSELNLWRVISKNEDGTVDVVSEHISSAKVVFRGPVGYQNFVKALNEIAKEYGNDKYVKSARHMGYSTQIEVCEELNETACPFDTGYEKDVNLVTAGIGAVKATKPDGTAEYYWLASRHIDTYSDDTKVYFGRWIGPTGSLNAFLLASGSGQVEKYSNTIRPILTLKKDITISGGTGEGIDTPYTLE